MANWLNKEIDLGELSSKQVKVFSFSKVSDKAVKKFSPGCGGCTTILGYDGLELDIKFKVPEYPLHLVGSGELLPFNKSVLVEYEDGSFETLRFYGRYK